MRPHPSPQGASNCARHPEEVGAAGYREGATCPTEQAHTHKGIRARETARTRMTLNPMTESQARRHTAPMIDTMPRRVDTTITALALLVRRVMWHSGLVMGQCHAPTSQNWGEQGGRGGEERRHSHVPKIQIETHKQFCRLFGGERQLPDPKSPQDNARKTRTSQRQQRRELPRGNTPTRFARQNHDSSRGHTNASASPVHPARILAPS